jgi:hypothetical protein
MYAIHNKENSYDVIDTDIMRLAEELKPKMGNDLDPISYLMDMHENNNTLSQYWPDNVSFKYFRNAKKANLDINILDGLVVFSDRAYNALAQLLSSYGEFLDILVEGDKKYLFNPLVFGEEDLTLSEREYFDGLPVGYKTIVFKRDDVDSKVLFKNKLGGAILYCNDEFVNTFNANNLTGIKFKPIPDYIYKDPF